MDTSKPHRGKIEGWSKIKLSHNGEGGLGYFIIGRFVDHPKFAGLFGNTSYVVARDVKTGEIETRNSRYTLVGPESKKGLDKAQGPRVEKRGKEPEPERNRPMNRDTLNRDPFAARRPRSTEQPSPAPESNNRDDAGRAGGQTLGDVLREEASKALTPLMRNSILKSVNAAGAMGSEFGIKPSVGIPAIAKGIVEAIIATDAAMAVADQMVPDASHSAKSVRDLVLEGLNNPSEVSREVSEALADVRREIEAELGGDGDGKTELPPNVRVLSGAEAERFLAQVFGR